MQPALQWQATKATGQRQRGSGNGATTTATRNGSRICKEQQEQQLLQQFVAKIQIGTFVEELRSLSARLRHRPHLLRCVCICVCAVRIYGLAGVTAKWDNIC